MPPARKTQTRGSKAAPKGLGADTRICVLHGPDPMVKREHFESLRAAVQGEHGSVATVLYDGKTASLADVLDELRSFALLEPHKLVVVDQADQFVTPHRAAMERYAQCPVDQATLVLRSEKWNRGNLDKLIAKVGCVIKCEPPSPAEARKWLVARAKEVHGRELTPAAAQCLVEHHGSDLMQLDSELGKLAAMVEGEEPIQPAHVEQVVGRSSDEQAWVVQEALLMAMGGGTGASGAAAVEKIREVVQRAGQPAVLVAYFVADLMRQLYVGVLMRDRGCDQQQIADRLKLWGGRRAVFLRVVGRLDASKVSRLFDWIIRFDVRAKTGLGDSTRNLECFCALLADEVQQSC